MRIFTSYLFQFIIFLFLSSNSFAETKYKTFKELTCKFNGAEFGNSAYPRHEIDKTYKKKSIDVFIKGIVLNLYFILGMEHQ